MCRRRLCWGDVLKLVALALQLLVGLLAILAWGAGVVVVYHFAVKYW